ncbi:PDZ domain-containing protein [Luteimonas soli]|uniref:PDZ domain-containing protein n=1 Tax=Luteimonas soli TaxID=1648966 RepID=A0ABV7XL19_9GAMM
MNNTIRFLLATALAAGLAAAVPAHAQAQAVGKIAHHPDRNVSRAVENIRKERRQPTEERFLRRGILSPPSLQLRPVIGVVLSPDEVAGVRITAVTPGSSAEDAGLRTGDRIVMIDGRQLEGSSGTRRLRDAQRLLSDMESDAAVRIGYVRDGKPDSVEVTPRVDQGVYILRNDGSLARAEGSVRIARSDNGATQVSGDSIEFYRPGAAPPGVSREIARLSSGMECTDRACDTVVLMSAFRWNGLNLATIDKQLGRYFGTDRGVLVLSSGDLAGLQAGDVIQRIDGKAVASPREAMAAMGDKPGGTKVSIDYLRDRKAGNARVVVPELAPLPPLPPAPPAPPKPPKAPSPPAAPTAPQAMAPPPPPAAPAAPKAPAA